jgi:hypothetical protein
LNWEQSVLRNIAMILRLCEADGPGAEARVLELLREFDLLPLALRPVNSLAREQYTQALALDPAKAQAANIRAWLQQKP